jgi:hypothetical protein
MEKPDAADFYSCSSFSKRIWPIWVFLGWLLTLAIFLEIFNANHHYKPLVFNPHESGGEFESEAITPWKI